MFHFNQTKNNSDFTPLPEFQHFFDEKDILLKKRKKFKKKWKKIGFSNVFLTLLFFLFLPLIHLIILHLIIVLLLINNYRRRRKWETRIDEINDSLKALGISYKEEFQKKSRVVRGEPRSSQDAFQAAYGNNSYLYHHDDVIIDEDEVDKDNPDKDTFDDEKINDGWDSDDDSTNSIFGYDGWSDDWDDGGSYSSDGGGGFFSDFGGGDDGDDGGGDD